MNIVPPSTSSSTLTLTFIDGHAISEFLPEKRMEEPDFVTAVENEVLSYRSETNPYDQKNLGMPSTSISLWLSLARLLFMFCLKGFWLNKSIVVEND